MRRTSAGFLPERPENPAYLRRLLSRAGDPPSPICNNDFRRKDYSLECVDCPRWFHRNCLNMTKSKINAWSKWQWHCECTPRAPPTATPTATSTVTKNNAVPFLQLNIDGWNGKSKILNKLLDNTKPLLVILQETKFSSPETPNFPGYTPLHRLRKVSRKASSRPNPQGDIAILVLQGTTIKKELGTLDLPLLQRWRLWVSGSAPAKVNLIFGTYTGLLSGTNEMAHCI